MPGFGRRIVIERKRGPRVNLDGAGLDQNALLGSIPCDPNNRRIAAAFAPTNRRHGSVRRKRQ